METKRDFKTIIQNFVRNNKTVKEIQFVLKDDIEIEEICGKGIVNYVFRVTSQDQKESAIIKYGESELKVQLDGMESFSLERQVYETVALKLLSEICPGSAPEVYCFDDKHHIIAMENLQNFELLGSQLAAGVVDANVATRIGKLLATVHNKTSKRLIPSEKFQELEAKCLNMNMKDMFIDLGIKAQFTGNSPMMKTPEGGEAEFQKVADLETKHNFSEKLSSLYLEKECFIHGDCHSYHYAIFSNSERIALFDLEMCNIGHPAFDIGMALAAYPLNYQVFGLSAPDPEASREQYKMALHCLFHAYLAELKIYAEEEKSSFIRDLALGYGSYLLSIALFEEMTNLIPITTEQRINLLVNSGYVLSRYDKIDNPDSLLEALLHFPSK